VVANGNPHPPRELTRPVRLLLESTSGTLLGIETGCEEQ
jgi:hypothetical protein